MIHFLIDIFQDFGNCFLIFEINKILYVFGAIVKSPKQSKLIIRLGITHLDQTLQMKRIKYFILESQGVF